MAVVGFDHGGGGQHGGQVGHDCVEAVAVEVVEGQLVTSADWLAADDEADLAAGGQDPLADLDDRFGDLGASFGSGVEGWVHTVAGLVASSSICWRMVARWGAVTLNTPPSRSAAAKTSCWNSAESPRIHWCGEDPDALSSEHLVEAVDELVAAIADQRPSAFEAFAVADEQAGVVGSSGWCGGAERVVGSGSRVERCGAAGFWT